MMDMDGEWSGDGVVDGVRMEEVGEDDGEW